MSVPEEERLSQKLDECLGARERMIQHAEHLQEDLMGAHEVLGRVHRLLTGWEQDLIFVRDYAQPTRDKVARLNTLEKQIDELRDALSPPLVIESPQEGREI